ncbi:MAG: 4Fe-4S binding protein [Acidobacteriota bacterium]|jgi:ferredoxin/heme/copper-type cytochrome/quinol oxidase subunit 4
MGNTVASKAPAGSGEPRKLVKAALLSFPMVLLTGLMTTQGRLPSAAPALIAWAISFAFLNVLFFLMVYTGKTHRFRAVLFVVTAVCFVITFMSNLLAARGSLALTRDNVINGETPFCHLVIPMTLLPAVLKRTVIFPGAMLTGFAAIATMLVIWLGASLALGRGWCSWVCFFGGLDEGFSCIRKKPVIKNIDPRWTYMPHAVLLGAALTSTFTLSPTYCQWLCPFKAVTEFEKVDSFRTVLATIIFVSLFAGLVVVLPVLTRRRIQCGLFCPFASFQSFFNKLNIFDIRIDRDKCTDCNHCVNTCPTFSIDKPSVARGSALLSCTKCGHCVDACPKKAVSFHIKGTRAGLATNTARLLFLYPAYIFAAAIGGGMINGALLLALSSFRNLI